MVSRVLSSSVSCVHILTFARSLRALHRVAKQPGVAHADELAVGLPDGQFAFRAAVHVQDAQYPQAPVAALVKHHGFGVSVPGALWLYEMQL